ncbi:ATPase [Ahniella affigens]|uniref:ATPase n=1 Tax=Ahniella affigens TaxID=2021234 RepID=A0A2P1PPU8_9GAMM|nr:SRPBCC domain-containing protein [Ahniella affigens]AVP96842.1 ATPase [Ahniella affigens]
MATLNHIQFEITINAAADVVWQHITALESYKYWTSAFAEGSYFQGSWEVGSRILFLAPSGDGMVSEIAESRRNEFLSIRHLGMLSNGTEDTTSEAVRSWAPAYENYTLQAINGGTRVVIDQDVPAEWADHLSQSWPKALGMLAELCESKRVA